jgi:hypothetical protein
MRVSYESGLYNLIIPRAPPQTQQEQKRLQEAAHEAERVQQEAEMAEARMPNPMGVEGCEDLSG